MTLVIGIFDSNKVSKCDGTGWVCGHVRRVDDDTRFNTPGIRP